MAESEENSSLFPIFILTIMALSLIYAHLIVVSHNVRIILQGIDIQHHNIIDDTILIEDVTYRPQPFADGVSKDQNIAVGTIGFAKDSKDHINIQGFNVYHKNRLIKVHITQGDHMGKGVIVSWVTMDQPGSNKVIYGTSKNKLKFLVEGIVTS